MNGPASMRLAAVRLHAAGSRATTLPHRQTAPMHNQCSSSRTTASTALGTHRLRLLHIRGCALQLLNPAAQAGQQA